MTAPQGSGLTEVLRLAADPEAYRLRLMVEGVTPADLTVLLTAAAELAENMLAIAAELTSARDRLAAIAEGGPA